MSPEERDELMQFILQSQSNAAKERREAAKERRDAAKERREIKEDHRELRKIQKKNATEIAALAAGCRDLLKVALIHSRRLDRLDGLGS